jgi:Zn-finger nucleic acid-binding protein
MLRLIKKHSLLPVFLCFLGLALALAASSATAETKSASVWSIDTDCASCHSHEASTMTNDKTLLSLHADQACTTCHVDDNKIALAHKTMTTDVSKLRRLKRTSVSLDTCVACHGTWEDLAELTKDVTIVKDAEGTVVNPHTVATVRNVSGQHLRVVCTTCHQMHTDTGIQETANTTCRTCHHQNVYACGTCHD